MNAAAAPALRTLQRMLQRRVLGGDASITQWVRDARGVDAPTRLRVYADAYRLRLLEVLGKDYPALRALLGDGLFTRIGDAYLDAHPSRAPSVRGFGQHLAQFLAERSDVHPAWIELARFEWQLGLGFDATDAPRLRIDDLAQAPVAAWPSLRFELHPSVARLAFEWNAPLLWQALTTQQATPAIAPLRAHWLVRRVEHAVLWRSLDDAEIAPLDALASGASFGELCETLAASGEPDDAPLHAASLLKRWLDDGLISALRHDAC